MAMTLMAKHPQPVQQTLRIDLFLLDRNPAHAMVRPAVVIKLHLQPQQVKAQSSSTQVSPLAAVPVCTPACLRRRAHSCAHPRRTCCMAARHPPSAPAIRAHLQGWQGARPCSHSTWHQGLGLRACLQRACQDLHEPVSSACLLRLFTPAAACADHHGTALWARGRGAQLGEAVTQLLRPQLHRGTPWRQRQAHPVPAPGRVRAAPLGQACPPAAPMQA